MLDIEVAKVTLVKVCDALEDLGAKYYIDSGTLLGAYRDKAFIPYDHDIDVRVMPGFPEDKMPDLTKKLWEIGFYVITHNYGKRAELICINRDKLMLDLKFAYRDDKWLWTYCWELPYSIREPMVHIYPRKFFEQMGEIDLCGRKYPCPSPIEGYLEHHYGQDWKEFKKRPEQADETDLTWDFMHSPPCSKTLKELVTMRNGASPKGAPSAKNKNGGIK